MSNWAEKYMKKQGWKETGGIGKTLQGRSEPVKECFEYSDFRGHIELSGVQKGSSHCGKRFRNRLEFILRVIPNI